MESFDPGAKNSLCWMIYDFLVSVKGHFSNDITCLFLAFVLQHLNIAAKIDDSNVGSLLSAVCFIYGLEIESNAVLV